MYQTIVESVGAAAAQGQRYSADGQLSSAADVGVTAGVTAGAAARKEAGAGMQEWLLVRAHLRLGRSFLEDEGKAQCAMDVCAGEGGIMLRC